MAAVQPEDSLDQAEEQDFWQKQEDMRVRVHVRPRRALFDPRAEASNEEEIEAALRDYPNRVTKAEALDGATQQEFRDTGLEDGARDVSGILGGPWRGYTYFLKEPASEQPTALEETALYCKFDEEAKARKILSKGQKKQLSEFAEAAARNDATMWAQFSTRPPYQRSRRLLPRGCRHFLLELFAGAAALTMMAGNLGIPFASPVDLQDGQHDLEQPDFREKLWARIEAEDPYLLVIAPNGLPWSLPPTRRNREQQGNKRRWYPVAKWIAELFRHRLAKGRHTLLGVRGAALSGRLSVSATPMVRRTESPASLWR